MDNWPWRWHYFFQIQVLITIFLVVRSANELAFHFFKFQVMKNTIQPICLFAAFLLSVFTTSLYAQTTPIATPSTPKPLSQPDLSNQMTAFTKAWQDAYNRGDNAALKAMYANEVMRVNADGTTTRITRDQIGESYSMDFNKYKTQTEVKYGNAILLLDGTVRLTGTYTTTFTDIKNGEKKPIQARMTMSLSWTMAHGSFHKPNQRQR